MTKEELKNAFVAKGFSEQFANSIADNVWNVVDSAYQAGQEAERERCIKIIKEMGLHLGYANNVITRINKPNQH